MGTPSANDSWPAHSPLQGEPATRFGRQLQIVAFSLLILALGIHLLKEFATVLQQLLIAAFLAYLILPIHSRLVHRGVPSALSFLLITLLILGSSFGLGQMIYHSVADFNDNWPRYQKNVQQLIQRLSEQAPEPVATQIHDLLNLEAPSLEGRMKMLQTAAGSFFDFLSHAVLVVIYLVFILSERMGMDRRLHTAFAGERAARMEAVVARINASISQYLAVKTSMSLLGGVVTTLVLWVFGVDYAVFWGIIAFVFNYIPYLGSIIAVVLPVLLCAVQFDTIWRAPVVLAVLLVLQNGIGYVLEPRLAGSRLNLSPLVIILSLAFWGTLWGIVGMILAVPLVVVVKSILENIPETKPLATLLSNE